MVITFFAYDFDHVVLVCVYRVGIHIIAQSSTINHYITINIFIVPA